MMSHFALLSRFACVLLQCTYYMYVQTIDRLSFQSISVLSCLLKSQQSRHEFRRCLVSFNLRLPRPRKTG